MILERCPFLRIPEQRDTSWSSSPPAQLSAGFVIGTSASSGTRQLPEQLQGGLITTRPPRQVPGSSQLAVGMGRGAEADGLGGHLELCG